MSWFGEILGSKRGGGAEMSDWTLARPQWTANSGEHWVELSPPRQNRIADVLTNSPNSRRTDQMIEVLTDFYRHPDRLNDVPTECYRPTDKLTYIPPTKFLIGLPTY